MKITFKREPVDIYHKYKLQVLSCAFVRFKLIKNAGIFYHKSISANHLPVWGHMFDRLHWNIKATFLMDFHFGNFCWTDIFVDQSSTKLIRNSQWPREFICVNYYFIILLFSFAVIQINSWKKKWKANQDDWIAVVMQLLHNKKWWLLLVLDYIYYKNMPFVNSKWPTGI